MRNVASGWHQAASHSLCTAAHPPLCDATCPRPRSAASAGNSPAAPEVALKAASATAGINQAVTLLLVNRSFLLWLLLAFRVTQVLL